MKKLYYTFGLACMLMVFAAVPQISQAQTTVGFGIRGGANFATFNNTDADYSSRTGFMAGGYFNFTIPNSPISIQPEVLYTQKGAKYDDGNSSGTVKLDYVEVPVLAKFDYITDGAVTPNVYFGPSINFNVNADADAQVANGVVTSSGSIEDEAQNTNLSVVVGGGIDFSHFNIGVRYDAGLTKAFDDGDAKNGVFSIVAGIDF